MNFIIIYSEKDLAGKNIARELEKMNIKLQLIQEDSIYAENIDKEQDIKEDFIIFASKHKSEQERKTFSIHAPGNWNKAELGGQDNKICKTSAFFLKHLFITLNSENKKANSDYEVTLEVTHHGPYLEKPCCFIEIGTTEKQWKEEEAGKIIARTINRAIKTFNQEKVKEKYKPAIGIGGPHYTPNFNKIQLNSEYAIGHIIPGYTFPITKEKIREAINKTEEKVEYAILDWKGMKGEERQEAIKLLNQLNLKYLKTSDIKKEKAL